LHTAPVTHDGLRQQYLNALQWQQRQRTTL